MDPREKQHHYLTLTKSQVHVYSVFKQNQKASEISARKHDKWNFDTIAFCEYNIFNVHHLYDTSNA